jgi:hypothetical protein
MLDDRIFRVGLVKLLPRLIPDTLHKGFEDFAVTQALRHDGTPWSAERNTQGVTAKRIASPPGRNHRAVRRQVKASEVPNVRG